MRLLAAVALLLTSCVQAARPNTSASTVRKLPSDFTPPQVFKNLNLLKSINLEKGYVRETINIAIENVDKKPQSEYFLAFPNEVIDRVGGLEAWEKNAELRGKFPIEAVQRLPER